MKHAHPFLFVPQPTTDRLTDIVINTTNLPIRTFVKACSQMFSLCCVFYTFMARPVFWHCSDTSLCSCQFARKNEILSSFCFDDCGDES